MRMRSLLFSLSLLFIFKDVASKRILAVEFFGTKSHVLTYLPLMDELAKNGHSVTLLSPLDGGAREGIRQLVTIKADTIIKEMDLNVFEMKEQNVELDPFKLLTEILPKEYIALYDRTDIQSIMEETFDLIILQPVLNDCALGLVHKVMQKNNAPLILFTPTSAPSFIVGPTGGHHPPSFVPNGFTGFRDEMTFFERMENVGAELAQYFLFTYYYLPVMENIYREKLGNDIPSAREILSKASIILSNGHFSISGPRPNLPNVIDVGGIHSRPAQSLPLDLDEFVQGSGEDGFILFSFGTGARGDQMPTNKRQLFLSAFAKLKQRIIWKYESENIENLPKNVMLSKWFPQQDLLGHPKIKLFITHCGLGGMEESIFHGVPLIGIPILGDQPLNAKQAENHGFLLKLEWNELTEEIILNSINTILKDPSYKRNVQELSGIFKDQIDNPLGRALWWTEYVMRHKGAPKLQSPARKLNFVQYHSIDVALAYLSILVLALCTVWKVIRLIFSTVFMTAPCRLKEKRY